MGVGMSSRIGMPAYRPVTTAMAAGGLRVLVRGEVDIDTVGAMVAELRAAEAGDATSIVLDLSGVSFLDSMASRRSCAARCAPARTVTACAS